MTHTEAYEAAVEIRPRHMLATQAFHLLGDLSRDEEGLCVISREDPENFWGNWTTGFGFFMVRFPKATTRELTLQDVENRSRGAIQMPHGEVFPMADVLAEDRARLMREKDSE